MLLSSEYYKNQHQNSETVTITISILDKIRNYSVYLSDGYIIRLSGQDEDAIKNKSCVYLTTLKLKLKATV